MLTKPRNDNITVIFEAFEIFPAVDQILLVDGPVRWSFPDMAASLLTS